MADASVDIKQGYKTCFIYIVYAWASIYTPRSPFALKCCNLHELTNHQNYRGQFLKSSKSVAFQ
jgi:hypothetical protein